MIAIKNGMDDALKVLLAANADIAQADERAFTALHLAAELGREDAVRALLASTPDDRDDGKEEAEEEKAVDAKDALPDEWVAVETAHRAKVIRVLQAPNSTGHTALHLATQYKHDGVVGRFFPLFLRFSIGKRRNCPLFRGFC